MTAFERRSFAVAVALGLIYLALLPLKPYPLSWLLKPIPMLIFALLAWRAWRGTIGTLLGVAFIGAAGGDFFCWELRFCARPGSAGIGRISDPGARHPGLVRDRVRAVTNRQNSLTGRRSNFTRILLPPYFMESHVDPSPIECNPCSTLERSVARK